MEKAFDRVGHHIIVQALRAFGVPEIMIMAIQHYTLVGYAYVEVNGRPGILITIKTGSGQGDPLSSILFLIATEPLNRLLASLFPDSTLLNLYVQTFSSWAWRLLILSNILAYT
jgi:hypothetical protein